MNRLASLAKVNGYSWIAGVVSIHMQLPLAIPATPAVLPLGTERHAEAPLRGERYGHKGIMPMTLYDLSTVLLA